MPSFDCMNWVGYKNIESIIEEHAEGDIEFKREFSHRCSANYAEFIENFRIVTEEQNIELLKKISHKIQSLNVLFEFDELQGTIEHLKAEEVDFDTNKELIDDVFTMSRLIVDELERIRKS